jgi:DNA-binding XRE family transcriptional regulator
MRNSVIQNWDGKSPRRQSRRQAWVITSSSSTVSEYNLVPDGFLSLDNFLSLVVDTEVESLLPQARKSLRISRMETHGGKERLADIRLEVGLSQLELARKLNTSQPRLSLWESGKERPSFECLQKLKESLGTDYNRLMESLENV